MRIYTLYLRQLTGDGRGFRDVVSEGGLRRPHGGYAGELGSGRGREDGLVEGGGGEDELQTVFDPEIASTVFPILEGGGREEGKEIYVYVHVHGFMHM